MLRGKFQEILIHTGQHYDYNMSDVFFEEMGIPKPDYNLGVSGGSHGQMTGLMLIELEKVFIKEKPDMVLLFGDTNSTMAAALAAVKLHIPICHVEAGNRFGTLQSPEEVNRIVTDHMATINLACIESSLEFLKKEGLADKSYVVGDPMYDAFLYYSSQTNVMQGLVGLNGEKIDLPKEYYYLTCHRQENTDVDEKLKSVFDALEELDAPTIYPVHPRNRARAERLSLQNRYKNLILTDPVGYKESIALVNGAKVIITDSGGVQREAFFAKKQCVTLLDFVVCPETMVDNCNQLAEPDKADILEKMSKIVKFNDEYKPFGDGKSANKIVDIISEYFKG